MIFRPRVVTALLAALFILAIPASASAAVFEVDSTGDQADETLGAAGCKTSVSTCTLRAALEESNASTGVKDTILFKATEFQGKLVDTITPATALPEITDPAEINAGTCPTEAGLLGPCAGVTGAAGPNVLSVAADDTAIYDLAINGGTFGVAVVAESTGFVLRGSWVGVKLDGSSGGSSRGVYIGPDSDEATIGGTAEVQRNVIVNSGTGLDIEGADDALVQGNWFGIKPDGTTGLNPIGRNIEITDLAGATAAGNEVGATVEGAAATSAACDGGCNVISGTSPGAGIDLAGSILELETPATGPTTIHGNFIGLDPTGTNVLANAVGVYAGGADNVTVGGFAAGDTNYVAGGSEGIVSGSGAEKFTVLGNRIGFGSDGSEQAPPSANGIFVLGLDISEEPEVENNAIRMVGGAGIEVRFLTGRIIGNEVAGGTKGIVAGTAEGGGLIASNDVDAATEYGILIESPKNDVRGNTVTNTNGPGIAVKPPPGVTATIGNAIGGSTTGEENLIAGSDGPAIEVVEEAGEPGSWTEITRNRGGSNGGLFIDLVTGANQGILPPVISAATKTKAEGTADAGATVRLFRKATASPGEIESFLGEAVADGTGKWSIAYGSVPGGTNLAASQTAVEVGTSELALAAVPADPSANNGGGGGNNGDGNNGGGNAGKDKTPPDTKILKGPPKKTKKTTVKFKFSSTEAGSSFQCKLDRKPFKACASPKKYKKLKPGKHTFKVRAIDKAGNVDPTPAKRSFTVLK